MRSLFFVVTNNAVHLGSSQAERNFAKHGVSFEDAWEFDWAGAIVVDRSRPVDDERRQAAIGLLHGRVCTLIFPDRPDGVRLISFRRANRSEEKVYEKVRPWSAWPRKG